VSSRSGSVEELKAAYPGRHFTPDGHLVGSIGEARETFGFELLPASATGHDAVCTTRGNVQIKITGGKSIALHGECDHLIVLSFGRRCRAILPVGGPDRERDVPDLGERGIPPQCRGRFQAIEYSDMLIVPVDRGSYLATIAPFLWACGGRSPNLVAR
jgi:hypothetical protein